MSLVGKCSRLCSDCTGCDVHIGPEVNKEVEHTIHTLCRLSNRVVLEMVSLDHCSET